MKKATLIALLLSMGVSKANAEKIATPTADDGTDTIDAPGIVSLLADWKTTQAELFKNDATIIDTIKAAEKAKNYDQFERKMKQTFGLTSEDIAGKKFDEIVALAKTKATEGTDKTSTELQQKIVDLTAENKKLTEEEIPKIKGETATYKKNFDIKTKFKSLIPNDKEILRLPFETAEALVQMDLDREYDVDLDDKGDFIIKQKGVDLLAKNTDGTKFLTMPDFINSRLEHHGALKKSNAAGGGAGKDPNKKYDANGKEIIVDQNSQNTKSPALKKAEAHQAALEAEGK